ncbi:response regulator [Trichocoleus sp. FACHB-46]|uniref:Response regulator n=2 Tax=Trichocoleus TaxID=450526 RepID=A0ABV0JEU0_9CYAN|nr:response regulator [Trichocoleus sp. FACHB-46]
MRLLLSGISVLVVDDNLETLELFDLFLTQSGATVATAITVETALKTMKEFFPDILITDLKLPDGNGYALLDLVRNLQSGSSKVIPAIAVTGYSTRLAAPSDSQGAVSFGFQKFLVKPVNIDELLATIAELTRSAAQGVHPI